MRHAYLRRACALPQMRPTAVAIARLHVDALWQRVTGVGEGGEQDLRVAVGAQRQLGTLGRLRTGQFEEEG